MQLILAQMSRELNIEANHLINEFKKISPVDPLFVLPEVSLKYASLDGVKSPLLHILLIPKGIIVQSTLLGGIEHENIKVVFFLINAVDKPKQQLRMLSRILDISEHKGFLSNILEQSTPRKVIESLLHNQGFISLQLVKGSRQAKFINNKIMEISLPSQVLVAYVERDSQIFIPKGNTLLKELDVLTIIGVPSAIDELYDQFFSNVI